MSAPVPPTHEVLGHYVLRSRRLPRERRCNGLRIAASAQPMEVPMQRWWNRWKAAGALGCGAVLAASVVVSCSRSVPASFPTGSAASTAAVEAPAAQVAVVLAADPPLPGESTADWPGLEDADAGG